MQRGVIVDTAIFVVMSALLHSTIGLAILEAANVVEGCSVFRSLAADANITMPATQVGRCSPHTDLLTAVGYSLFLSWVAFRSGVLLARFVVRNPHLFNAIYGPYFDVTQSPAGAYVIADVMTKTAYDGRVLVYEGYLVELSLTGSRTVNFVCLEGASRFYLTLGRDGARTTSRHQFRRLDANHPDRISRMTIPGSEIANLVTRTYAGVELESQRERGRRSVSLGRSALSLLWRITLGI